MRDLVVTVTLNPSVDKTAEAAGFRVGGDFRTGPVSASAGGKGINVSRALKALGQRSIATGLLGGDAGAHVVEMLAQEGLAHDFVRVAGETRTNLTIIDPASGFATRLIEPGPKIRTRDIVIFRKKFSGLLKRCAYVVLSGSLPPGVSDAAYRWFIEAAKRRGVKTVLDTQGKALAKGLAAQPFFVKPNQQEAEYVVGRPLESLSELKGALRHLTGAGIEVVCISMAAEGAIASCGGEALIATPPKVRSASRVGCGDSLVGGFIASFLRNVKFRDAFRYAVAAGAANALSRKPGAFKRADLIRAAERVTIRSL